ncbi:MAG: phosphotransferase system enzyme I (PtsI) [Rubritalea sp.]|jgi:phosphotransferase system enzyme I (PtsI)
MPLHTSHRETILQGTAVSPGLAFGPVHVIARGMIAPEVYEIAQEHIDYEISRFEAAIAKTKVQLSGIQKKIEEISGDHEGLIFEAHILILEDSSILKKVREGISSRLQNAEFVYYAVIQTYCEAIRRMNDKYLAERATDIDDVAQRVIRNFSSADDAHKSEDHNPEHKHIIVAYDLSPSDTATMDRQKSIGFITEQGSVNSHTAILSRSLGIPAIVGLESAVMSIKSLTFIILDGYSGQVILNPSPATIAKYREIQRVKKQRESELDELKEIRTQTTDDRAIILSANIEFEHELTYVEKSGAEGIGLFRTEFYLLGAGEIPDENRQTRVYTEVAKRTQPHQAIIRTLDAGGDKLPAEPLPEPEPNPFLGWRGIRVSLARQGMFKEQLRAILRASAHGKLGVMFPLISGLTELLTAKDILKQCMDELDAGGVPFDPDVEVGMMIEVPSAALMAEELGKHVDFFSIGTNDLIQYTLAVDRVNKNVSKLYKPTNPAVIRLIDMTAQAARNNGIWTGVCGEMASDLNLTPLLIGLGIDELSVGTHQLPKIKKAVRSLHYEQCQELANNALKCRFSNEIYTLTQDMAHSSYPFLID